MGRWVALAALAAFLAGMMFFRAVGFRDADLTSGPVTRTTLALGPEERLWIGASSSLALSPDGARIAFVGDGDGRIQLYLRELDSYDLTVVRGSDGARDPFFSPDGDWIGFFAEGEIKKVAVDRGIAESVAEAGLQSRGASWGDNGEIIFAQDSAPGLFAVAVDGGDPRALSELSGASGFVEHLWPQWLPGNDTVLFTLRTSNESGVTDELAVFSLETKDITTLGDGAQGTYLPSGHIVYIRGGAIEAVVFDSGALELKGSGIALVEGVNVYPGSSSTFAVSSAGTLAYLARTDTAVFRISDREGRSTPLALPAGTPGWPRIAPNGRLAVLHLGGGDSRDLWVLDLDRPGSIRQLTFQGGGFPTWSADGSRVAFMSRRGSRPMETSSRTSRTRPGRTRFTSVLTLRRVRSPRCRLMEGRSRFGVATAPSSTIGTAIPSCRCRFLRTPAFGSEALVKFSSNRRFRVPAATRTTMSSPTAVFSCGMRHPVLPSIAYASCSTGTKSSVSSCRSRVGARESDLSKSLGQLVSTAG